MEAKQMSRNGLNIERLYYKDSHLKEFEAVVLSCEEKTGAKGEKDGFWVVLDRTAFFPEGGGQFGDIGWLEDVEERKFMTRIRKRKC